MQEYLKYQQSGNLEDYPKWGAFYAEDIEVHYHTTGPLGVYFFGQKGFVEWYRQLAEGVDFSTGAKADHKALIVDGNVAVVRFGVRSRRRTPSSTVSRKTMRDRSVNLQTPRTWSRFQGGKLF